MKKAVFVDRDGTVVHDPGFVHRVEDFRLLDGVVEGLRKLEAFTLFIITNQSGINLGHFTEKQMHEFNQHLLSELKCEGVVIEKLYFNPYRPDEGNPMRKPGTGMIDLARNEYDIDIKASWVIGDKPADIELAKNVGCRSILVLTGEGSRHVERAQELGVTHIAKNVDAAANFILKS